MQASNAFASAGAAAPDEFYDQYTMDLEAEGYWARARRRFFRHRLAVAGLLIFSGVCLAAIFADRLARYGYNDVNVDALSSGPSWSHPFGTDQVGRDYFSRTVFGLRTELELALVVGVIATVIGAVFGAVSGYVGGLVDVVIMRFADLLLTVPPLVAVLVAAAFLRTDTLLKVCALIACVLWMPLARVVRGATIALREQEYVQAARAVGASDLRILRKHILPNAVGSVVVAASVVTASAVLIETTLSYLGLGINNFYGGRTDTKRPSVGDVLAAASNEGLFNWWGIVFPGLTVILVVAPIYLIGDGVRDALDPTQRRYVSERELKRRRRGPSRLTRLARALPRPHVAGRWRTPRRLLALVDALPRRRGVARRRLLLEAAVVLALTAAAGAAVYAWQVNPLRSDWTFAATHVQDVSRARAVQTQVSVAANPVRPAELLAASNESRERAVRVYASNDDGRTWTSTLGPSLGLDDCQRGDPSTAVDASGRQYLAFTVSTGCIRDDQTPYVAVATRASPSAAWKVRRLGARRPADFWDDYPSVASGPDGRVYVAWSRLLRWTYEGIVVSSSADGGRTWTTPHVVSARLSYPRLANATVAPDGTLYVAGVDARFGVWVARSRDAGRHFDVARAAPFPGNRTAGCATASQHPTPFQGTRCVGPNPSVVASADRVFVTYGVGWPGEAQTVRFAVLDRKLRPLWRGEVAPANARGYRFWPAAAFDATTRKVWVCFYDTSGDRSGRHAWFACSTSRDGRTWTRPRRAARDSSSPEVLWEDARVYSFGDVVGYGGYTGVTAAGGVAHPLWIDTRDVGGREQEIFGATMR